MKKNNIANDLLLVSAAPALLLMAFIFELILMALVPGQDEPVGAGVRVVMLTPLFILLTMAAVIGLIWVMTRSRGFGRLVSITYLVLGLLVLYSNALLTILPLPEALYVLTVYSPPNSMVGLVAGALAALGLISLWFWKPQSEAPTPAVPEQPLPDPKQ